MGIYNVVSFITLSSGDWLGAERPGEDSPLFVVRHVFPVDVVTAPRVHTEVPEIGIHSKKSRIAMRIRHDILQSLFSARKVQGGVSLGGGESGLSPGKE
jgi:hypothetical protein